MEKNIYLRAIELDEAQVLRELMNNSQVLGYVIGRSEFISLSSQKEWIKSINNDNTYRLIIVDAQSNGPIGVTGLWNIDWQN